MICRDNSASAVQKNYAPNSGPGVGADYFLIVNYYLCSLYETHFV